MKYVINHGVGHGVDAGFWKKVTKIAKKAASVTPAGLAYRGAKKLIVPKATARTDARGRTVAKVSKPDLVRYLQRKAFVGEYISAGVGAPAQTPYDDARVLMIESMAQNGALFEISEGVDGVIAEIYSATPYQMPDAEVAGLFSGLKKAASKLGKNIAKATKAVIKNPIMKKIGIGVLAIGGVVTGVALGPAIIGTVAKFGGKLIGKAASAAAKLIGGGKTTEPEPQPADESSATNVPEQLFNKGQVIYIAEPSMVFDQPSATSTQDNLKTLGQTMQGASGSVQDVFSHPQLGQFCKATWNLVGSPSITGWVHQSMLSANLIPPASTQGGKPTADEMNALTAQLANVGQKDKEALEAAQALAQARELVGKTADQAISELKTAKGDSEGAQMVTENSYIEPRQPFMLDAWIGTPVVGAMISGETTQITSKGEGRYIANDRVSGDYTPAYDDGLTAILGRSKSGRENPLPENGLALSRLAVKDIQDEEGGVSMGLMGGAASQYGYQDDFDEMSMVVAAEAVEIKPGQKLAKGTIYKSNVPLVIKGGKAVHASLVKRIITNKWTWIGVGGAVLLGVGTGVAVSMSKKKKAVGHGVGSRVRRRR